MLTDPRLPGRLIYRTDRDSVVRWLKPVLIGLALITVGSGLVWLLYRWIGRYLKPVLKKPKLSAIMAGFFVCLSIPILIFILAYNYYRNSEVIIGTLKDEVAKTRQASIENVEGMIQGVAGTLRLLPEVVAADPGFFRTDKSGDVLYRALTLAEEIDTAFVSFEDGYHRAVTRIDDDRRRSDPKIPSTSNWHMNFIDDFSAGGSRSRHRTFFDVWGHIVGQYVVPTKVDYALSPGTRRRRRRERWLWQILKSTPIPATRSSTSTSLSFALATSSAARQPASRWTC